MRKLYIIASVLLAFLVIGPFAEAKSEHLRILSFNVRIQQASDEEMFTWNARKDAAVNAVKKQKPDIIGLQEAASYHKAAFMAEMPEYQLVDRSSKPGTVDEQIRDNGNPIIFRADRLELLDYGYFWLNSSSDENVSHSTWVKLRFKKSGQIIFFFNCHYDYESADRDAMLDASKMIVSKMKEIAGDDAVAFLAGDFSLNSGDSCLKPLNSYLTEVNLAADKPDLAPTYNGFGANAMTGRFDHIFSRNAAIKSFQVVDDPKLASKYHIPYISDHYPVFSDFDIIIPKAK